jgi:nicotinamidase-related amidase
LQRAYGLEVPQNLKEACDPRRLALVVYDMQVGVVRQIQGGGAVTAKVAELLRAARDAGIRVFFLRHMSLPKELDGGQPVVGLEDGVAVVEKASQ